MSLEREAQLAGKYRTVFESPVGKDVLRDLAKQCNAFDTTAWASQVDGKIDPYAMALAEGRRQALSYIFDQLLYTDPEDLVNMRRDEQRDVLERIEADGTR